MLDVYNIKRHLRTKKIGRQIYYYEEVDSTNIMGHQLARAGAPEGSLLLAEYQTAGKGRLGRHWFAKKGENLLMSIILRPEIDINKLHLMTFLASIVIIKSLQFYLNHFDLPGVDFRVKWPNDVLVRGKKIAGVLSECKSTRKKADYVIVGMGINLNQVFQYQDSDLGLTATSLRMESKHRINRENFLTILLTQFDDYYLNTSSEKYETVLTDWREYWDGRYSQVKIDNGHTYHIGFVEDISTDGTLLLKSESGSMTKISSGETVSWN
jgi:BirA family biotin operon repressor/biotin-[acetyl-CoA-carboxylase] ligase